MLNFGPSSSIYNRFQGMQGMGGNGVQAGGQTAMPIPNAPMPNPMPNTGSSMGMGGQRPQFNFVNRPQFGGTPTMGRGPTGNSMPFRGGGINTAPGGMGMGPGMGNPGSVGGGGVNPGGSIWGSYGLSNQANPSYNPRIRY